MADSATEIDLDSVIDRLLEGELAASHLDGWDTGEERTINIKVEPLVMSEKGVDVRRWTACVVVVVSVMTGGERGMVVIRESKSMVNKTTASCLQYPLADFRPSEA